MCNQSFALLPSFNITFQFAVPRHGPMQLYLFEQEEKESKEERIENNLPLSAEIERNDGAIRPWSECGALSCVDYIDTDVSRMRKRESIIDRQTRRALFY